MTYTVLSNDSLPKLIEMVNNQLKEGWSLQGGICTRNYVYHRSHHGDAADVRTSYSQAMVKNDTPLHY